MVRFLNSRAELKRIRDGAKLYGWVLESRLPGQIQIKIAKGDIQPIQEPYELTLSSRLGGLMAVCVLGVLNGDCATFALPKTVEIILPPVASRIKTPPFEVHLAWDDKSVAGTMIDIANAGVGVRVQSEVPKGTQTHIEIFAAFGRRAIDAIAVYSKPIEGPESGWFRTGFRVDCGSRLSQANWRHIFDFVVEQAILECQHRSRGESAAEGLAAMRRSFELGA